jgi:hypothetical protein
MCVCTCACVRAAVVAALSLHVTNLCFDTCSELMHTNVSVCVRSCVCVCVCAADVAALKRNVTKLLGTLFTALDRDGAPPGWTLGDEDKVRPFPRSLFHTALRVYFTSF